MLGALGSAEAFDARLGPEHGPVVQPVPLYTWRAELKRLPGLPGTEGEGAQLQGHAGMVGGRLRLP
jgi:hypothetical protein